MRGYPNDTIKAWEIMTPDVVCLNDELDLHECERLLVERGISGAPVVDQNGHLLGVLSKTDLVTHHLASGEEEGGGEDSLRLEEVAGSHVFEYNTPRARALMSPLPCTATETCSLGELAALMIERGVHRVVILRQRKIVGIVSTMDILRVVATGAGPKRISFGVVSEPDRSVPSHPSAA